MHHKYKLENGATVVLIPQANTKSVTTMVMYPVGSRHEEEKLRGVSHYVEHLMFKGTEKRDSTLKLTKEIDRLGAQYNAFTGKEYTGYYIKTDGSYIDISLDILSDMLFNSLYDNEEMEREKHVIVEEIRMYNDNPIMNIDNVFEDLLFNGCPLGVDIAGTEQHVLHYDRDDVIAYRDKHYQPENMTVVLAGNVDEIETKKVVEKYFAKQENKSSQDRSYIKAAFGSNKKEERVNVQYKKTDQAQMMIGFPSVERGNDLIPAISVMNSILGGSMSSRLFIKIRERLGLAYSVRSGSDYFEDAGYVYVQAALEAKNINKAISAIKKEIEKIKEDGVTHQELEDAKTHMQGSMTLAMENSTSIANWYAGRAIFTDDIESPEQWIEKIKQVTLEDVKKVANQFFDMSELRVAIIGDVKKEDIEY